MPEPKIVELPAFAQDPEPEDTVPRNSIAASRIDGSVEIRDNTIFASKISVGSRTWVHNLTWTATDNNTASWSSGTLQFNDGSIYSILSGNTGNISATTYVYFDGTDTLKTTTTYTSAIGDEKVLLAIVAADADSAAKCVITAIASEGTTIDGDKITTGRIQSTDQKTYFDLNDKRIIINDGTYDRILIGYQSSGF